MSEIPSPERFFLEVPPYSSVEIGTGEFKDVMRIQFYRGTLDTYCAECSRESVFKCVSPALRVVYKDREREIDIDQLNDKSDKSEIVWPGEDGFPLGPIPYFELEGFALENRVFRVIFECTRNGKHLLHFFFRVHNRSITKVGQYPSLADLHLADVRKYRKVLGDEKYRELTRAIGLNAHGVGIGSFVYLRRILEDLINAAKAEAAKEPGWDEEAFGRSRMDGKIQLLQGRLPKFLVEHRHIYSILSLGIHELTEKQCLDAFETVRVGIELILDEKLHEQERAEKTARATKDLSQIKGELKKAP